jgi:hypothetical protein
VMSLRILMFCSQFCSQFCSLSLTSEQFCLAINPSDRKYKYL